jgi:tRNA threonylcarbamoyladenosine biosynthesis protein TsaE
MEYVTRSGPETRRLGEALGRKLQPGDIVLLFGELGAGKTTFAQGIAEGLDLDPKHYVRSPTFTLVNEYQGRLPIFHIDLYRLNSAEEIRDLGLEEYLFGPGVTVVEWAEKLFSPPTASATGINLAGGGYALDSYIEVHFTLPSADDQRRIRITPLGHPGWTPPDFTLQ